MQYFLRQFLKSILISVFEKDECLSTIIFNGLAFLGGSLELSLSSSFMLIEVGQAFSLSLVFNYVHSLLTKTTAFGSILVYLFITLLFIGLVFYDFSRLSIFTELFILIWRMIHSTIAIFSSEISFS